MGHTDFEMVFVLVAHQKYLITVQKSRTQGEDGVVRPLILSLCFAVGDRQRGRTDQRLHVRGGASQAACTQAGLRQAQRPRGEEGRPPHHPATRGGRGGRLNRPQLPTTTAATAAAATTSSSSILSTFHSGTFLWRGGEGRGGEGGNHIRHACLIE